VEFPSLHVFVGDFGLATTLATHAHSMTLRGGTPGFQAPEQLRGDSISPKCDVYAFGGVLTELFGGKPLWGKLTAHAISFKVGCEGKFPDTDHLPPPIKSITDVCFKPLEARAEMASVLVKLAACDL